MTDTEAGARLRTYIEERMAERQIASVSALAREAGVSRDTFQQWWIGRPPARGTGTLVATALGVAYADLIAAREGAREPAESDLGAALLALTEELAQMRREREAWTRGVLAVLRAYEGGQVPADLLDALAPQLPEDARR